MISFGISSVPLTLFLLIFFRTALNSAGVKSPSSMIAAPKRGSRPAPCHALFGVHTFSYCVAKISARSYVGRRRPVSSRMRVLFGRNGRRRRIPLQSSSLMLRSRKALLAFRAARLSSSVISLICATVAPAWRAACLRASSSWQ